MTLIGQGLPEVDGAINSHVRKCSVFRIQLASDFSPFVWNTASGEGQSIDRALVYRSNWLTSRQLQTIHLKGLQFALCAFNGLA